MGSRIECLIPLESGGSHADFGFAFSFDFRTAAVDNAA